MAAPFVATSRLANIIQMVALSRQTGILRVIRGHGPTKEFGQIRFIDGEPQSALLGMLMGQQALNALNNWGECQYAFDEVGFDAAETNAYGSMSSAPGANSYPQTGPASGSWPTYSYQYGGMGAPPPEASGPGVTGGYPPQGYTPQGYGGAYEDDGAQQGRMTTSALPPLTPDMLGLAPLRTAISAPLEQLPLDRRERMVLMLVDGQRTIADLARLTRRQENELYSVLGHLEALGLVQIRGW